MVAGGPALVRTGGDELRREAALLGMLAGRGVPAVLALDDDGATVRLAIALAPPLRAAGHDARAVAAQVAAVLARAHDAGVVHGPLLEEHLLGSPDEVVVGGWAHAGPGDPATDVAEVGRLLQRLAGDDPELAAIGARALATDPPTMAAIAASLAVDEPSAPERRTLPRGRLLAALGAAAVLVVAGVTVGAARPAPDAAHPDDPPATVGRPTTTTTTTATTTTTTATTVTPTTLPIAEVHGNEIEVGGRRYRVGRPGDAVVVGDFDCDGQPAPAVLRPATGQLWTFDGWADGDQPVTGTAVATVPGAIGLRVATGDRCDQLEVVDAAGRAATVG